MKKNNVYKTGLIFLILTVVASSFAAVPKGQCIGVDNRECRVLDYGVCEYTDTKERGVLMGKHQICTPQIQTNSDTGLVSVMWYDDSAKVGENMSQPSGAVDDRQCEDTPKVDGIPQEVWNQALILDSYISSQFWIMKKMKDEKGECAVSIYPVVKIIQPDIKDKNSIGKIIFDETKPVLRIYKPADNTSLGEIKATQQQKPSIVSVKSTTPGSAKLEDLLPSYHYVLSSQSGDAELSTLFLASKEYRKKNWDKPAPLNRLVFSTYYNYMQRTMEVNKYAADPCIGRDAVVSMTLNPPLIEQMQKNKDPEAQYKNAQFLMSLERCKGISDSNYRN